MKATDLYKNNKFLGCITGINMLLISVYRYVHTGKWSFVTCSIAILFLSSALFYQRVIGFLRKMVEWTVTKFTDAISIIVLSILYFLVLTPMNLVKKAFGKDGMKLKNTPHELSYWQQSNDSNSNNLQQQF